MSDTQTANTLTVALVSAASAFGGAILSSFVAPRVQHSLWRRQQLADLRRAVISDLNKIAAEYVTAFMTHQERGERYEPTDSVFAALYAVDMQVRTLFTPETHYVYKEWQIMVARHGPARTVHDFVDAQEAALRSMYKEAGFIK